jgi:transcriptional regulator with XRE-family HTH domain
MCNLFLMPAHQFDFRAFHRALDAVRQANGLTWRQVSQEAGVSPSSVSRMARGNSRPDIDTVAALAGWAEIEITDFLPAKRGSDARPFATVAAYLQNDPKLTTEAAAALEQLLIVTYARLSNENSSGEVSDDS